MADNNIIIKITSEADLTAAQQQLEALEKESEALAKRMELLRKQEKEDAASIKALNLSREQEAKRLKENAQYYQQEREYLIAESKERKQSIQSLSEQVKAYKTLNGMSGKVVQQLRAMREELMRMEDAGEFGTQAFVDLSIAAAQLEDQIGDTQQRIRILASDTKNMDAVMGLGEGLAGSFYVATSGAELLGGEMEGLQKAFYKVQAAMSVVSGTQQVYNALQKDSTFQVVFNTAVEKLAAKSKDNQTAALGRNTKAWLVNGASSTGASIKLAAHTVITKIATVAQAALNAVIYANPFVLLAAAVSAAAAAIVYFATRNKEASDAAAEFNEANKKLEETEAKFAIGEEKRQHNRQEQIRATEKAEENALFEAKKRNASEIELGTIKAKYAKQRADETRAFNEPEIKRNKILQDQAKEAMEAKRREADAYKDGSKKQKQALEELAEAEQKYYGYVNKRAELAHEIEDADKAATDAEQELAEQRRQYRLQAEQANLDLMKDGATKEIAQINLNYREQLKTLQGNSSEEVALRKALLAKQAKEIASVRKKYAQQAQQVAIQEQKNMLTALAQSTNGTEADYQQQLQLTKDIAKAEAQARIDALDEEKMDEKDYAAQVKAIRLELQQNLREIDEQELQRKNDNAKRLTDIALQEAEAEKNALTGAEGVDEQKRVWDNYYAAREKQIRQNAEMEKAAVERSTDSEEVKAAKIKQIDNQLRADLTQNAKDGAQARLDVDAQYLSDLELEVSKTQEALDSAQAGDKLNALKANYDAQMTLYDEQQRLLKAKYEAGLINYQDYKQQEFELTKSIADAEAEYQQSKLQEIAAGFQTALGYIQQVSDLAFEALLSGVQAEMDALEEEYTTDWEEAQKNADKKYITEKEYEKKKAALEEKQAKYAKAQALTNIAIQTALSIITTLAQLGATPWGIAAAAIAGSMGAAQLAIAAAKPLAQYEKGRKGGKGEYALVGEKGPEIMYVPDGASIVPNNKLATPGEWEKFGVPRLSIPEMPHADSDTLRYAAEQNIMALSIDYDRFGASVARHMPKQRGVTVNVDRSGVHVNNGGGTHTYLNTKYQGSWI